MVINIYFPFDFYFERKWYSHFNSWQDSSLSIFILISNLDGKVSIHQVKFNTAIQNHFIINCNSISYFLSTPEFSRVHRALGCSSEQVIVINGSSDLYLWKVFVHCAIQVQTCRRFSYHVVFLYRISYLFGDYDSFRLLTLSYVVIFMYFGWGCYDRCIESITFEYH